MLTGEKRFSCDVCRSAFSHKSSFKSDMQIHSSEKLFSYQVCGSASSQSSSLRKYIRHYFFTVWGSVFSHTVETPYFEKCLDELFQLVPAWKFHSHTYTFWWETIFLSNMWINIFIKFQCKKSHGKTQRRETIVKCEDQQFHQVSVQTSL